MTAGGDGEIGNVWVISQLYYPEETSTGYVLTRIAEGLASQHRVQVLCGQPGYAQRGVRAPWLEERCGVQIQRCVSTTWDKNVLLYKLVNFATISMSLFAASLRKLRRNDLVLVVTNPPILPFLVSLACRLRRARCVLLIHDVYPEVLVAVGKAKPDGMLVRALSGLTRRLFAAADRIVVLGRDMKRLTERKLGRADEKVVVIPNWSDIDEVTPEAREANALLQSLQLQDRFVLQYAGNMGYPNDLASIIESARLLQGRPDIHFVLIGGGTRRAWVEEQVRRHELRNVTLLANQPRGQQQSFLNACDVALISLVAGMAGVGVPSRTYNTLAAGKPMIVIADEESEVAQVVREEQVGWVVPPHRPEQLVEAILAARSQPQALAEMRRRARQAAEEKYSYAQVMQAYHTVVQDLRHPGDLL